MLKKIMIAIFAITISGYLQAQTQKLSLIPYPQHVIVKSDNFKLRHSTKIIIDKTDTQMLSLGDVLNKILNTKLKVSLKSHSKNVIELKIDKTLETKAESYKLEVSNKKIVLTGKDYAGIFYGIQTLKQLVNENGIITGVSITDEPRFAYRGLHLDVSRHFFPADFIKKFIDVMSFYKFNTLHWHLTDDQGWRIEIKKYPKLTEIGSKRPRTLIGHLNSKPHKYDNTPVEGYYTQDEIREIVKYAQERHITIIPEIELPGHASAALAAYPYLGCTGKNYKVQDTWGVFSDIFCAGQESTFDFLEDVIDEVVELFPSKYIHIGGDEARKTQWEKCPNCKKRLEAEGLKNYHELQSYFIRRIEKYINSKGRKIIGWDEILEGGLAPNATVMSWRGTKGGIAAANMNHDVIMTPTSTCYLNRYQADRKNEPLAIGGMITMEMVYRFNPIPKELPKNKQHYILGAQGNLWSEYITTTKQMEYMAYPRACALSEVLWSPEEKQPFSEFKIRMKKHYIFLDEMDVNYFDKDK